MTVAAEVEGEWAGHLGVDQVGQLREILTELRAVTDPYT